jgi:hypothetical protein
MALLKSLEIILLCTTVALLSTGMRIVREWALNRRLSRKGLMRLVGGRPAKDFGAPSPNVTGEPEKETLVSSMASVLRPQTFAGVAPEDAIFGVLDDQDARANFHNLPVQRAQRNTINSHAIAQVPAWPNLL